MKALSSFDKWLLFWYNCTQLTSISEVQTYSLLLERLIVDSDSTPRMIWPSLFTRLVILDITWLVSVTAIYFMAYRTLGLSLVWVLVVLATTMVAQWIRASARHRIVRSIMIRTTSVLHLTVIDKDAWYGDDGEIVRVLVLVYYNDALGVPVELLMPVNEATFVHTEIGTDLSYPMMK